MDYEEHGLASEEYKIGGMKVKGMALDKSIDKDLFFN